MVLKNGGYGAAPASSMTRSRWTGLTRDVAGALEPYGKDMNDGFNRLPKELADHFTKPFARFLRIEAAAGAILLFFAVSAFAVSNSPWSNAFLAFWDTPIGLTFGSSGYAHSLKHWINEGLMTLFFFVVALELKRELVLGELRNPRIAALSFAAALGGMLVPAGVFLILQSSGPAAHGWGTVVATDTAFLIACLAVLGSRVPHSLRLFLLSLAIFDDIGAILVVAVGYGHALDWRALALAALGLAIVFGMARLGVRAIALYVVAGILIWLALDASGIHATLTGVLLGLMTPTKVWISNRRLNAILDRVFTSGDVRQAGDRAERRALQLAGIATREAISPVERLESALHPWVGFAILPLFAFANAGVTLSTADLRGTVATAVFVGFVFGKPIGVLSLSFLAARLGMARRPPDLSWSMLGAGGLLTGIGFTMALLIAEAAFSQDLLSGAKIGILSASIVSAVGGILALAWLTRKPSQASGDMINTGGSPHPVSRHPQSNYSER